MNLTVYDINNTKAKPHLKDEWAISVNRQEGAFYLSLGLTLGLGITEESRALLAIDENGKWYVSFDGGDYGFRVRCHKLRKNPCYKFSCKMMAVRLCDETKDVFVSAKFLVSCHPTKVDGIEYHQIITKRPLRTSE